MRIGLVAAMPEECAPLLKRVGAYKKGKIDRFPCFRFTAGGNDACLVRSGMGGERAAAATGALIAAFRPELVISFGFGGGVRPGLAAGDLVIAEKLLRLRDGHYTDQPGLTAGESHSAGRILAAALPHAGERVKRGTFITTDRIEDKRCVAESLSALVGHPLLEMETCAVAQAASAAGVRIIAVRGVSDDAGEELGFSIAEFTDRDLNISVPKILMTLARRPWMLPQLMRLARNSRFAGERLAEAVMTLLEAPTAALGEPS